MSVGNFRALATRLSSACLILALGGTHASALDPAKAITQYIHDAWQTEQGLPQNTVLAICQTRDGYLWLGTQEGLVRFDGVRFRVYDRTNTPGLTQNYITALHEDRQGNLWIGTRGGGVSRSSGGTFTTFTTASGLSDDRIRAIHADRKGDVWIGTSGGGLNRFRDGTFTAFTKKNGLASDLVVAIEEDRAGNLWIGTDSGLNRMRDGQLTLYTTRQGLSHDQVSSIHEDKQGNLWIGTFGGGLNRFRDGQFTALRSQDGLSNDQVWSIGEDHDGTLWIGTDAGLDRLRAGKLSAFTTRHGLSNDVVVALLEDREASLWIGTYGGGLNRLRDGKFITWTTREGLTSDSVRSVYEDRSGSIWIGTDGAGVNQLKDGKVTAFTTKQGLSNDQVVSIVGDREGSLWIGTFGGGVNRFRAGRFSALTTKQGLSSDVVLSLYQDRAGDLWIGTDAGLNRIRDGHISIITTQQGLPNDQVVSIREDRAGDLWIGTSGGGLSRLHDGHFTSFTTQQGLSHDRVAAIHEDADRDLWIGTSGGGLNRFRGGRFTAFTTRTGLYDDRVFDIFEDSANNFWMSCNRGIFRASRADLEAFAAGKIPRIASESWGIDDGMRSAECNGENQPAGWQARDGRLWFPTIKGVVVVDPAHIPKNTLPPPVVLEEVIVDDKPMAPGSGPLLVLPAGSRKFDLHYTGLSFPVPHKVRFKYQLEGFDEDWVDAGTERTAHYTNLPPGSYTFRVKACNNDGVWNETGATLDVQLLPFFYQTRAFQALCGLALVLAGAGVQRLRMRRLQLRAQELERIVAEQTRDLRVANDDLRVAQQQLARLSEATPEKFENVSAWGTTMAEQIGHAIHARHVHVWRADGGTLSLVSRGSARPPSWKAVEAARSGEVGGAGDSAIVPVTGMTGELRGALVIEGPVAWGETERRLVNGLAQHLGSALDMQHLRGQLTTTEARQVEVRQRMLERGIHTLALCTRCGRCYDETAQRCAIDQTPLDTTRLLPFRVLERYRLAFLLGEGGMGSVFEAHDEKLGRDVALKVIKAEMLSDAEVRFRLEREAHTLAQIQHPSVIGLFDSGELEDGSAFLVMELLAGRDLADVLEKQGAGTPAQVATLLRQMGAALAATHRAGVIHRDIKPANMFLVRDKDTFQSKVLDFGLAKSNRSEAKLTRTGILVGTPAYMSPEQVEGLAVDARTDIYSLALVAYEALTGGRVVPGQEVGRMFVDILYTIPPRISSLLPGLSASVDAAFEAALAKRPDDRPADIESWSDALATLLESMPAGAGGGWPLHLLAASRSRDAAPAPRSASDGDVTEHG